MASKMAVSIISQSATQHRAVDGPLFFTQRPAMGILHRAAGGYATRQMMGPTNYNDHWPAVGPLSATQHKAVDDSLWAFFIGPLADMQLSS